MAFDAGAAEQADPAPLNIQGSFPAQYTETVTSTSRQNNTNYVPFLGLTATSFIQPDLSTSIYTSGGHDRLGGFRDNDNTFSSFGGDIVKRWGSFRFEFGIEHTTFYNGLFDSVSSIANDASVTAHYHWTTNSDLKIRSSAAAAVRTDDIVAVQRYALSGQIDIEQRLFEKWWLIASPRFRYYSYVNNKSGRRDVRPAFVTGLKYAFNEQFSAMMLTGWEDRASNVVSKSSDKFFVGASLDFNVNFWRP